MTLFCILRSYFSDAHAFSNQHVAKRCSKSQVVLLSKYKAKFAVLYIGMAVIIINYFMKETNLLSNITKIFLHYSKRESVSLLRFDIH